MLFVAWLVISLTIPAEALTSSGHEQVTGRLAEKLGFSSAAVEVLQRGAVWPDFSDWDNPAAHAQTPNEDDGKPTRTEFQAEMECGSYLWLTGVSMHDELRKGHVAVALFILGVGLHTIQDFAAHQGMTNTEHSYLSYDIKPPLNPDVNEHNIDNAQKFTEDFLSSVHKALGEDKWNALLAYQMSDWSDQLPEKFRNWTIGPITLAHYHHMGVEFVDHDRVRWNRPDVKATKDDLIASFVSGLFINPSHDTPPAATMDPNTEIQ
jgi:hypothetical protein